MVTEIEFPTSPAVFNALAVALPNPVNAEAD